jgi:hypothetical protein
VKLELCDKCARNCRADVYGWKLYGTPIRSAVRPSVMRELPASVFGSLPPAAPSTAGRNNITIPFPVIKRDGAVQVEQPVPSVYPQLLDGHDLSAVERAATRWRFRSGCRAEILARNLDPVKVLLAADTNNPDEVIPDKSLPHIEKRRYLGLQVVVAKDSRTILDAYV